MISTQRVTWSRYIGGFTPSTRVVFRRGGRSDCDVSVRTGTLANPIEEFTCPRCEEKAQKKSLTKHPSLDARIAERRAAAGEEFKY
jgi:hypothetical protein